PSSWQSLWSCTSITSPGKTHFRPTETEQQKLIIRHRPTIRTGLLSFLSRRQLPSLPHRRLSTQHLRQPMRHARLIALTNSTTTIRFALVLLKLKVPYRDRCPPSPRPARKLMRLRISPFPRLSNPT